MSENGIDQLAAQLVNYNRSYLEAGLALCSASHFADVDDIDTVKATGALIRALGERNAMIDTGAVLTMMVALAGLIAGREGTSPRKVFEDRFKRAPTDEEWRAMCAASLDRQRDPRCPRCDSVLRPEADECDVCAFSFTLDAAGDDQPSWPPEPEAW